MERKYANNNLVCKGAYEKGLKDGKWIYWYDNGMMKESSDWKNGNRHGATVTYDISGKIIEEKYYRLGTVVNHSSANDTSSEKSLLNKVGRFLKRINIFRKKSS